MRLYERIDVRRAQIKANMHHIQDPEIIIASQLRSMKKSVNAEAVKRVLRATLQFSNTYSRMSREECEDIREWAKEDAMLHWIDGVGGLEAALAHSNLPLVLHAEATSLYTCRRPCGHKRRKRE